jgi:DNA-binding NarL/FixJ family response regulator
MILIIGNNIKVSEGLADILNQGHRVHFFDIKNRTASDNFENMLNIAKLIIINLYDIHDSGLSLVSEIRNHNSNIPIIALDIHQSQSISEHLMNNGVNVYLPLTSEGEVLNRVVEQYLS